MCQMASPENKNLTIRIYSSELLSLLVADPKNQKKSSEIKLVPYVLELIKEGLGKQ